MKNILKLGACLTIFAMIMICYGLPVLAQTTGTTTPSTTSTSTDPSNLNETTNNTSTPSIINGQNNSTTTPDTTATSTPSTTATTSPSTTSTTTPPSTPTSTPASNGTTISSSEIFGWVILPSFMMNILPSSTPLTWSMSNSQFSTSTTTSTNNSLTKENVMGNLNPSMGLTYNNDYPMLNGNYIDCNGNIDNDPAHHTTNPNDTDPAHHIGQNCPGGQPTLGNPFDANWMDWWSKNNWPSNWFIIPLTRQNIQDIMNMM
jgi:hypothetical protein